MTVPTIWTQNLPPDKREAFENHLRNNTVLIDQLLNILRSKGASMTSKEATLDDFKDPNWAYKQAYRNGYKTAIKSVINLFNFLDPKDKQ